MSEGSSFEDLEVWKRSKALAVEICGILRDCRDYGFRDQITRSALSVPSNISEGGGKARSSGIPTVSRVCERISRRTSDTDFDCGRSSVSNGRRDESDGF